MIQPHPIRMAISLALLLVYAGLVAHRAQAQQISPVIAEFNKRARGAIVVTNTAEFPKIVSCGALSFNPAEHGKPRPRPLDPALHVRLASERVEIAPKGSRQISFDAMPESLPAWFAIVCQFLPVQRGPGITVAMVLTSIVVIHGGSFDAREDVTLSAKRVDQRVVVEVKNNGGGLARVDSGEVLGHRKSEDTGTFLLYPHQDRIAEVDWKNAEAPQTVRIHIGKQRLEASIP